MALNYCYFLCFLCFLAFSAFLVFLVFLSFLVFPNLLNFSPPEGGSKGDFKGCLASNRSIISSTSSFLCLFDFCDPSLGCVNILPNCGNVLPNCENVLPNLDDEGPA